MIFYCKEKPFAQEPGEVYQGEALKVFNFLYFSHSEHRPTLKALLAGTEGDKKSRFALIDLAASFAAQLQYRDMLDIAQYAEHSLRYFKRCLQARGYKMATTDELRIISASAKDTVLLVTGCQTPEVRNARVRGAYTALKDLDVPAVRVVLSGANPGSDPESMVRSERVPIEPDEAGAMNVFFDELITSDAHPPRCRLTFHKESESTSTTQNIQRFFSQTTFDAAGHNHLLISSSAFHLPRIADEGERYLVAHDPGIDRVTLIQSEHLNAGTSSDLNRHQIYVKQMTFELYRMIFAQMGDRLDDLFIRETSLRV